MHLVVAPQGSMSTPLPNLAGFIPEAMKYLTNLDVLLHSMFFFKHGIIWSLLVAPWQNLVISRRHAFANPGIRSTSRIIRTYTLIICSKFSSTIAGSFSNWLLMKNTSWKTHANYQVCVIIKVSHNPNPGFVHRSGRIKFKDFQGHLSEISRTKGWKEGVKNQ